MKKVSTDQQHIEAVVGRAVARVEVREHFLARLASGKRLTIKFGIDPTAPHIHLGHLVVLRKLKLLQDMGHRIVLVIGDFTARIGDPTDKAAVRRALTNKEIERNMRTYRKQVGAVLDLDKAVIRYNSEWLEPLGFADVLELTQLFTAAQMLERDMFAMRLKAQKPIWLHEFMYPILQAYDSVALKSHLEVGGSDQEFNLLAARVVQPHYLQEPQDILTVPLLVGTDGAHKMSQSLGNYIGLAESPEEQFGKLMSVPDEAIGTYLELLTDVPSEEVRHIASVIVSKSENPRDHKMRMAERVVASLHGERKAAGAREQFIKVFQKKQLPDDMPECAVSDGEALRSVLVRGGITSSLAEADRLIEQGAVWVGGKRAESRDAAVHGPLPAVIKAGKRRFLRLISK